MSQRPDQTLTPKPAPAAPAAAETLKETLISIVIAFTLAFVFRGFVVEAFVIPTGSMAPTLLGQHMRFRGQSTGYDWAVGPWEEDPPGSLNYVDPQHRVTVHDPMSGEWTSSGSEPLHSGDRILVLKYQYSLEEPKRFDVIVFKNPSDPSVNYIKRLIGLPGEEVALVDGDVFTRPMGSGNLDGVPPEQRTRDAALWQESGWTIARKPHLQQMAVWQPVYDSSHAPLTVDARRVPWKPAAPAGWTMDARVYRFEPVTGSAETSLVFDQSAPRSTAEVPPGRRLFWKINDFYPYDEIPDDRRLGGGGLQLSTPMFPVSDLRVRAGVEPVGEGLSTELSLTARSHEFRMRLGSGKVEIAMRRVLGAGGIAAKGEWKVLVSQSAPSLPAKVVSNVEFWHRDQQLEVWLNDQRIALATYDWTPAERICFATGRNLDELFEAQRRDPAGSNVLATPGIYIQPEVKWNFSGPGFALHRVALDRDLFYQPASYQRDRRPAQATSPYSPLALGADQFFVCGDNSPASFDGRLMDTVDPWVVWQFPAPDGPQFRQTGVVPRDLLLGRAFFVYWPSLKYKSNLVPVPDFGRMRFIW